MATDEDRDQQIRELQDAVDALIEAITDGQLEMRALEMILAADHGLSLTALREAADFLSAKEEARQETADSAKPEDAVSRLRQFRVRGRVH